MVRGHFDGWPINKGGGKKLDPNDFSKFPDLLQSWTVDGKNDKNLPHGVKVVIPHDFAAKHKLADAPFMALVTAGSDTWDPRHLQITLFEREMRKGRRVKRCVLKRKVFEANKVNVNAGIPALQKWDLVAETFRFVEEKALAGPSLMKRAKTAASSLRRASPKRRKASKTSPALACDEDESDLDQSDFDEADIVRPSKRKRRTLPKRAKRHRRADDFGWAPAWIQKFVDGYDLAFRNRSIAWSNDQVLDHLQKPFPELNFPKTNSRGMIELTLKFPLVFRDRHQLNKDTYFIKGTKGHTTWDPDHVEISFYKNGKATKRICAANRKTFRLSQTPKNTTPPTRPAAREHAASGEKTGPAPNVAAGHS
ncbi:uncharacterized protein EHS24_000661 [Apiotrichum porosum]|uniref:Uncharacterized protein n=1 Tax=Apiotrichum porosum TaxID=105984 RepID=A0A427YAV7_9TREE|nr:uncharacterized protein EHS24_000661 [Apiotrichum porosum]RSH88134.1 hypothetical protein EHS24_000661 [Apiotrichum porosum]